MKAVQDDDEFLVRLDFQESGWLTRVNYKRDAFVHSPIDDIPEWLCRLSIDDLCGIEDAALHVALNLTGATGTLWPASIVLPLIAIVRQRRLPVSSADLWLTLRSHGFSRKQEEDFCQLFYFGLELLILLNGRPAIKNNV